MPHDHETPEADPRPIPPVAGPDPDQRPVLPSAPTRGPVGRLAGWRVGLAWTVLLLAVLAQAFLVEAGQSAPVAPTDDDPIGTLLMGVQARYMVGSAAVVPGAGPQMLAQADTALNAGVINQRLRYLALVFELGTVEDIEDALAAYDAILEKNNVTPTEDQAWLRETFGRLAAARAVAAGADADPTAVDLIAAAGLEPDAVDRFREDLGWFADLTLYSAAPDDQPQREAVLSEAKTVFGLVIAAVTIALTAGGVGFVLLVIFITFLCMGRVRSRFGPLSPPHGLYMEAFTIWMFLFLGLQVAAGAISMTLPADYGLYPVVGAFFLSLLALFWPVMNGVPWSQVRADLGLRGGIGEVLLGVPCYLAALPILAVGLGITLVLMLMAGMTSPSLADPFAPTGGPAHPIILEAASGSWASRIGLLLTASVAAPVVEEIVFRGLLYRHLRDLSRGLGFALSVSFGCLANAVIFAAIHPQGWVAIPALASLAIAFTLAREWRGSLWPPMVMHAVSNGFVMIMLLTILGSTS